MLKNRPPRPKKKTYQNVLEMRFLVNVLVAILSVLKHPPIFSYRKFPLFTSGSLIITRLYELYVMKTALNTTN